MDYTRRMNRSGVAVATTPGLTWLDVTNGTSSASANAHNSQPTLRSSTSMGTPRTSTDSTLAEGGHR